MNRAIERIAAEFRRSPHVRTMRDAKHLAVELVETLHGDGAALAKALDLPRVGGVNYRSWNAAAKVLDADFYAVVRWVNAHGTEAPFVAGPKREGNCVPTRVGGVSYPSRVAAANALGVPVHRVTEYIALFGSDVSYREWQHEPCRVGGRDYDSWAHAGVTLGVSPQRAFLHVRDKGVTKPLIRKATRGESYGWTSPKGHSTHHDPAMRPVVLAGRSYPTCYEAAYQKRVAPRDICEFVRRYGNEKPFRKAAWMRTPKKLVDEVLWRDNKFWREQQGAAA